MKSLVNFYQEHVGKVSDKWAHYLEAYQEQFVAFQNEPIRVLEIGVQNGGSLEIWSKFFVNAKIFVGCDINPDCKKLSYSDPRISVLVGDANSDVIENQIKAISKRFDLIIDDGSHTSSDIIKSFIRYFDSLEFDGLFVVEDLHCSYWEDFEGGLYDPYSSIAFFKRLIDVTNYEHWGTDIMRESIFSGFEKKYGVKISDRLLSSIHSVEFSNSLCFIRKKDPQKNDLGFRIVGGSEEIVVSGHHEIEGSLIGKSDQRSNYWSRLTKGVEEVNEELTNQIHSLQKQISSLESVLNLREQELHLSEQELHLSEQELHLSEQELRLSEQELGRVNNINSGLLNSRSWRITAPLRQIGHQLRRIQRFGKLSLKVLRKDGGGMPTLINGMKILCFSGPSRFKEAFLAAEASLGSLQMQNLDQITRLDYSSWIKKNDNLSEEYPLKMREEAVGFAHKPIISILMPTYNTNSNFLVSAIESVINQAYPYWELCIADDASSNPEVAKILHDFGARDPRIKIFFRSENGHISNASNSALGIATGEWIGLLDHDDLLHPMGLFCVAKAINKNSNAKLIYTDEDKVDEQGNRFDPYFKPDWNVDLFYSQNYLCHFSVYQKKIIDEIGGFRVGFEGAQDYDLALRYIEKIKNTNICHIPKILYHWRSHPLSTAQNISNKDYASKAGESALNEHFARNRIDGNIEAVEAGYRAHYNLPKKLPLVSLIIPTKNSHQLVRQCIESILKKTTYNNYEIILVDNNSDEIESLQYFSDLKTNGIAKVIRMEVPFNFSLINNRAVEATEGEIIGLINNDIEVISEDWLSEMVSLVLQDGVGAVGAKLLYPDNRLQHGGVILGVGGVAGHAFKGIDRGAGGYFSRANLISSYSAVTAACLVVKKENYLMVGGLDEQSLSVAFNDVDFCLKLGAAQLRNVWTPYAEMYHHESATRGFEDTPEKIKRFSAEVNCMIERWGKFLKCDPAYNPNLTLEHEDFSIGDASRVGFD